MDVEDEIRERLSFTFSAMFWFYCVVPCADCGRFHWPDGDCVSLCFLLEKCVDLLVSIIQSGRRLVPALLILADGQQWTTGLRSYSKRDRTSLLMRQLSGGELDWVCSVDLNRYLITYDLSVTHFTMCLHVTKVMCLNIEQRMSVAWRCRALACSKI